MSELVLNRSAYIHNLTKICAKAGGKDRVILVLKDNAYGHGAALVGREAASYGIKFCAVKNEAEARELEPFFEHILILSHIPHGGESRRFIYAVNDVSLISKFKKGARVHIAVDTLMHRNGVGVGEVRAACEAALAYGLQICGAFTHFRSAEELSSDYFVQNASFLKCDNITLGYSFDKLLKTGSWHGLSGRVYGTVSNVFTLTKYNGLDPEVFSGVDYELYPRPTSFILGLSLNF